MTAGWAGAGRHRAARGRGKAPGCWYQAPGRGGNRRQPPRQGARGSHHVQRGHGGPGHATLRGRGAGRAGASPAGQQASGLSPPGATGPTTSCHQPWSPERESAASLRPRALSWSQGTHRPCPAAQTDRKERVGWEEVLKRDGPAGPGAKKK